MKKTRPNLLLIDPHLVRRSPSMKSLLPILKQLLDEGWNITVWSLEMDAIDDRIHWNRVPCPFKMWSLTSVWFWIYAHARYVRHFTGPEGAIKRRETLIQGTSFYCRWVDIVLIQFVFHLYGKISNRFARQLNLNWFEKINLQSAILKEKLLLRPCKHPRFWAVVSKRLMEDLGPYLPKSDRRILLPNAYDPQRFNPRVREQQRAKARLELGLGQEEVVFAFVCLGAFNRKGFGLALEACFLLNQRQCPCRLLIIGGRDANPPDISPWMEALNILPTQVEFILARGRTSEVEHMMSAADALLFPSYCEAFSLAEIEAAALGLRLYLTPHYGAEMTLECGSLGRMLPWDGPGIAAILEEEIQSGRIFEPNASTGAALDPAAMAQQYRALLEEVWAAK